MTPQELNAKVAELDDLGEVDDALDQLFDWFNETLRASDSDPEALRALGTSLEGVEYEYRSPEVLIGYLSISLPLRGRVPERDALVGRVRRRLAQQFPDRVEAILRGLE